MKRTISRCLYGVLFAGGITLFGATAAHADTTGDDGVLSGTLVDAVVSIPVTIGGNTVSLIGDSDSDAAATTSAPAAASAPSSSTTSGNGSVAGGTQTTPVVSIPVTVVGNSVAGIGDAATSGAETPAPAAAPAPAAPAAPAATPGAATSGDQSVGGGTQVSPTVTAPVTIAGNSVAVVGNSSSSGAETPAAESATPASGVATTGDDSVLGGTQVAPVISVPINLGGNAVSVLGDAGTTDATTAVSGAPAASGADASTSGDESVLGGTQIVPAISIPINLGGNAVSVIGDAVTTGSSTGGAQAPATPAGSVTSGNDSVLGGAQVAPIVSLPITIGGNTVSVIGDAETAPAVPTTPGVPSTPGTPSTPGSPSDPATPVTPIDPATPVTPIDPATPATPDAPASVPAEDSDTSVVETETRSSAARVTASAPALPATGANVIALVALGALLLLFGAVAIRVGRLQRN
ncbi:DUF320 domain-containing protein [Mycetocola manganoxydans]|uniref:DUF320 domain-containing protein n=1 Tax=Mycetocola manganoxydans TaxID=699879 RepID=A0A3L6ZKE4_9MICO|nr:chaplin family protein [Mycetocola manganoxydans]RLP68307.1 DUF320 domain-containing protein [Mycetocola manganoxydans]GHD43625.1 hypothetical protein GCM10008097_10570 [Mycetocola manganoxydans]